MNNRHNPANPKTFFPLLTGFLVVLGIEVILRNQPQELIFWILAVLLASVVALLIADWWRKRRQQHYLEKRLEESQTSKGELERRLNATVRLNQLWMEARNEKELVEKSLHVLAEMTGALGVSFMPFDEWGQPLNAITHGAYPTPVLRAWAEHLSEASVRNRCRVCQKLETTAGEFCPLLETPFTDSVRIFCLPLLRNNQPVAMLNLYMPAESPIQADMHEFIILLLREMLGALDVIRLRGQETAALRQAHSPAPAESSLGMMITAIVERLCAVLQFTAARIDFRASPPHFGGLHLRIGVDAWLDSGATDEWISFLMNGPRNPARCPVQAEQLEDSRTVFMAPTCLPGGTPIGVITFISQTPSVEPISLSMIELVAAQCALLVESERSQQEREYRVILQERIRLAREIHDSLAQTLAYLKLTAAQMQNQLAQGDLHRLEQLLSQSHQALADAYLETRQVIDNLRLTPADNMILWLESMTREFEKNSGLNVQRNFPAATPEVEPEIQAQLLRIIQEALSNIRKHAKASSVGLDLRVWNGTLVLEISDDGVGFSAEDVPEFSRHGLRGMRERAELIGADFQVISKPLSGTTVRIHLPINEETPV